MPGGQVAQIADERGLRTAAVRGDVGGEALVARHVLPDHDGRLGDLGMAEQQGFDLGGFDAEAPDLDLVVGTADIEEFAVPVPAGEVPGAVHPCPRRPVGVGDETAGGQRGPAEIAARQLGSRNVQLACHAGRHGAQRGVQDVGAGVPHGAADGNGAGGVRVVRAQRVVGAAHSDLGRPVVVDHGRAGMAAAPLLELRVLHGLPAHHQLPGGRAVATEGVHVRQVAGCRLEERVRLARGQCGQPLVHGGDTDAAAADQCAVEAGDAGVERDRSVVEGAADDVRVRLRAARHIVHEVPVLDHHALRAPRRPGRVDHVGGMARVGGSEALGVRHVGPGATGSPPAGALRPGIRDLRHRPRIVEHDDRHPAVAHRPVRDGGARLVGEDQGRSRVADHVGDAVGGIPRVHRYVGGTRFEHGEERRHQVGRAVRDDGDQHFGAGAAGDQVPGEPVGARVQLAVRQPDRAVRDGGRLRCARDLPLEESGERGGGHRVRGVVPSGQELVPFLRGQHVGTGDPGVGVGGEGIEDTREPSGDLPCGVRVEQIVREGEHPRQAARRTVAREGLLQRERQIELGGDRPRVHRFRRDAGQLEERGRGVLERQHHLEQWVTGHRPGRCQLLHQALEGHVLVGEGVQRSVPDPGEELGERRVAAQIGAEHQRVYEEADQLVQRLVGASGDGCADGDVVARTEPGQQYRQCGLHHHEHRDAPLARQPRRPGVHRRRDGDRHGTAPVTRDCRARPVRRKRQLLRKSLQSRTPVRQLLGEQALRIVLGAEQVALPQRVVGVLHGQRLPDGRLPGAASGVGDGQVTCQWSRRPAVGRDVVDHEHEQVLTRTAHEQPSPHRHFSRQVEDMGDSVGHLGSRPEERRRGRRVRRGRPGAPGRGQRRDRQPHRCRRFLGFQHVLDGPPVHDRVHRTQHLVPRHHVDEGGTQCGGVQIPGQADQHRHRVQRARTLQLVQEPQALLRRRQRDHRLSSCRFRGRSAGRGLRCGWVSSRTASAAGVGLSKSVRRGSSTPRAVRTRLISRVASSEWPPRSKNESSTPTLAAPSTSENSPHSAASRGVRGARYGVTGSGAGTGRAAVSSLPFAVTGSPSTATTADGTMYGGNSRVANARSSAPSSVEWRPAEGEPASSPLPWRDAAPAGAGPVGALPMGAGSSRRVTYARSRVPPSGPSARATTAACPTAGCVSSAVSISAGSMRKPRILTWSSVRPMNTRSPSVFQRARSPVRYMRVPGSP